MPEYYEEREYYMEQTARSVTWITPPTEDGRPENYEWLERCRETAQDLLDDARVWDYSAPELKEAAWAACPPGTSIGDIGEALGISLAQEEVLMSLGRATEGTARMIAESGTSGEPPEPDETEELLAAEVMNAHRSAMRLLQSAQAREIPADQLILEHPAWVKLRKQVRQVTELMADMATERLDQAAARMLGIYVPDEGVDIKIGSLLLEGGRVPDETLRQIAGLKERSY